MHTIMYCPYMSKNNHVQVRMSVVLQALFLYWRTYVINANIVIFKMLKVVKPFENTCSCGKGQLYHLPSLHVLTECVHTTHDFWQYIPVWYTLEKHRASYAHQFQLILHHGYWNDADTLILYPNMEHVSIKGRPRSTKF